jgi:hypothetical protein
MSGPSLFHRRTESAMHEEQRNAADGRSCQCFRSLSPEGRRGHGDSEFELRQEAR